ncbi:DUF1616 domain-containing protein [Halobacteria archaeon AArc-dxtr1]|nr:DUF1616 domain-containing protein [Halobacteria archaeon AArc-dxtr1]
MSLRERTIPHVGFVFQYPLDLALVSLATLALAAALVVTTLPSSVALLVTLPFVFFLPGYALVSVLFPAQARRASQVTANDAERRPGGIDTVERLALSFALSLTVVIVAGIALPATEWGLGLEPIVAALGGFTIVFAQLGAIRRLRVPAAQRYRVAPQEAVRRALDSQEGTLHMASSIVLVVAILAAAGALLFAFAAPLSGSEFTTLATLSEDNDGELVAGELPDEVFPGQSVPFTTVIENYEGETTDYEVVVQQQYFEDGEITDRAELTTASETVEDGDVAEIDTEITPTADDGETVRVSVLLYEDEPPDEPTNQNAMEDTYFWLTVSSTQSA